MNKLNRRRFLELTGSAFAAISCSKYNENAIASKDKITEPVPMIHATDLYHTHGDPDDHWDLASVYALAYSKSIKLHGILIDFPPKRRLGDPDVMGVAQMNYLSGLVVPTIIGTPYTMNNRTDIQPNASNVEHQGINWVIDTLKKSQSPVVINIVGAATDIAIAANMEPELFKEKCKAIYLNAGSADTGKDNKLEFNVALNPSAYSAIFDVDCPVYWLPCWNETEVHEVGEYGSYYRFLQNDILPSLSKRLQNFFLFMLGQKKSHKWFDYLNSEMEQELLEESCNRNRNMWCTAGFINAAGKKVTPEGEIVSVDSERDSVFSFIPTKISCNDDGYTTWDVDNCSNNRYILHVDDPANYQKAMTLALKTILNQLPG
ncbi:MAG: nucleoside hydrolase [Bacteroidota bacterium]